MPVIGWLVWTLFAACFQPAHDRELVGQLDREILALRKRNAYLQGQLESCGDVGVPHEIYAQLVQVFSGSEVRVERDGARSVVIIPGGLLFAPGQTVVRDEAGMVLDLLATALNLHTDQHVWIVGHTDDQALSGSLRRRFGSNWELSSARAADFMRALVDDYGVDPERFTIAGRGPIDPVASNDTPEGRALNRRIVVVIGPYEQWR